jgi:hypothetical protein
MKQKRNEEIIERELNNFNEIYHILIFFIHCLKFYQIYESLVKDYLQIDDETLVFF